MKNLKLIENSDEIFAETYLNQYYQTDMIPAEKKKYLTNLRSSIGPYMGIESKDGESHYLMDAASQIATLGLGFNPSQFFGTAHLIESWTNNSHSSEFKQFRKGFEAFLQRKLNWTRLFTTFCHSGAEANEIALGYCYKNRKNINAKKILAFEGSFHGRMMMTLTSTWNKSKREPFEWPEFQTEYVKYPGIQTTEIHPEVPSKWKNFWSNSCLASIDIPGEWQQDPQLNSEIQSLLSVHKLLFEKKIFSIIIEPMQCEGGDNYGTSRFYTALLLMARSFNVKVIFDEVQTGFHLGRNFFWHRQLNLTDDNNQLLTPDYVVCAKKSQVGIVLSHQEEKVEEEFQVASAVRGYIHAVTLDQQEDQIHWLEKESLSRLKLLLEQFAPHIHSPRCNGLAFAFDLNDSDKIPVFIKNRFDFGLLYYPAGKNTLRFRLNTSFTTEDLDFLFNNLRSLCEIIFNNKQIIPPTTIKRKKKNINNVYDWHELLLNLKLNNQKGIKNNIEIEWEKITKLFELPAEYSIKLIDINNFIQFKEKIIELQKNTYEPTRQTSINLFEQTAKDANGIAIAVSNQDKLIGIAFTSPLKNFPLERGVRRDPSFSNPKCLYMLDTTVDKSSRGLGLGRSLKYALTAAAILKKYEKINGRNRDRIASSMLSINLSLGSYEIDYLKEDYPDFEKFRDVYYYTSQPNWKSSQLNLSNGINSPLDVESLSLEFMKEQLPTLVNKICLSNFVSSKFLSNISDIINKAPELLRHGYTASGQSETVDKITKSIWFNNRTRSHLVTFEGHFFGRGSFLSRSLSLPKEEFFPTTILPHPTEENQSEVIDQLESVLSKNQTLAVWIEPIRQKFMDKTSLVFLQKLKILCTKFQTPLVFNETASSLYRYDKNSFFISEDKSITPDAIMSYMGGQIAVAMTRKEHFVKQPLMMISTWDGDEFALGNYHNVFSNIEKNKSTYDKLKNDFTIKLTNLLKKYNTSISRLKTEWVTFRETFHLSYKSYF